MPAELGACEYEAATDGRIARVLADHDVVARALGENLTKEQLGSAAVHTRNGVADNVAKDETDAFTQIRQFLSYMPRNAWELVPDKYIGDPSDLSKKNWQPSFRVTGASLTICGS